MSARFAASSIEFLVGRMESLDNMCGETFCARGVAERYSKAKDLLFEIAAELHEFAREAEHNAKGEGK